MYALRVDVVIPESHHLVLDIPTEIPSGDAEILVMSKSSLRHESSVLNGLAWLSAHPVEGGRSEAEIDGAISADREAWG